MKKSEQALRVRAIAEYLEGIGQAVTNVQCYEILARALGLKNKHVLASTAKNAEAPATIPPNMTINGKTVPVMSPGDKPLTVQQMQAMNWEFDVIIPMSLDELLEGNIERQNELASEFITGNEYALEGIGYAHIPEINYGKGYVAYRVIASISEPEWAFGEDDYSKFYEELSVFAALLQDGAHLNIKLDKDTDAQPVVIRDLRSNLIALLKSYANGKGDNNEEVNGSSAESALVLYPTDTSVAPIGSDGLQVSLSDLKYATKMSNNNWHVSVHNRSTWWSFNS